MLQSENIVKLFVVETEVIIQDFLASLHFRYESRFPCEIKKVGSRDGTHSNCDVFDVFSIPTLSTRTNAHNCIATLIEVTTILLFFFKLKNGRNAVTVSNCER